MFSKLQFSLTGFEGQFDSRCPMCANDDNMRNVIHAKFDACGIKVTGKDYMYAAHYVPAESEFVQTLLRTYENYTGLKGECLAIGGGTYSRMMPNTVAFGVVFPEEEDCCHIADEYICIESMMKATRNYAHAIAELASHNI